MEKSLDSKDQIVEEIIRIHECLPSRPEIEEIEAANSLIQDIEKEDQARLDAIDAQIKSSDVPEELFNVLLEMKRSFIYFQSKEQKREATKLLDLENAHVVFDEMIQRAFKCIESPSSSYDSDNAPAPVNSSDSSSRYGFSDQIPVKSRKIISRDDTFVPKSKSSFYSDGLLAPRKPQVLNSTFQAGKVTGEFNSTNTRNHVLIESDLMIHLLFTRIYLFQNHHKCAGHESLNFWIESELMINGV